LKHQRELTAGILIPAVLAILIAAPLWAWAVLVAIASSIALFEFYGLVAAAGWIVPRAVGFALFLALLVAAYRGASGLVVGLAGAALFALPTLVMLASPPEAILFPSSAASVFSTLYVAAGAGSMIGLRAIGWRPVLFLLAIVWAGDSAAYYVGRKWGVKKLAPIVSPKKTWAGFFGQLVAGTLVGLAAYALSRSQAPTLLDALLAAALGFFLSLVAVVGDLVESTFKRSVAIKDSGGILPGHGGFLDRLDSLLYASPALLLVGTLLPRALPR
jgi:phosphatidate cytidylyltransferase